MQEILEKVIDLVKNVGEFQLQHFRADSTGSGTEKCQREFVSFVDIESEKMLRTGLTELLPHSGFFGEETENDRKSTEWIVDPIDGTTNFLSGLAQFSISVALYENGKPQLGVVYQPATGDLFSATAGNGFFHNGRRVTNFSKNSENSEKLSIDQALIGTGFPYRSEDLQDKFFSCAKDVLNSSRGIRRMGSAALDLSYLAAGYLQGFWETDLQPYDVAAALLFMQETGIKVTNLKGNDYNPEVDRLIIAAFPKVHKKLLQIISKSY